MLSVDTGNFYSNSESYLHKLNHKIRRERNKLKKDITFLERCLLEYGFSDNDIKLIKNGTFNDVFVYGDSVELKDICLYYRLNKLYKLKGQKAKEVKSRLLTLLSNKNEYSNEVRTLSFVKKYNKPVEIPDDNIISVFESFLTRCLKADIDKLCYDFMVIQVYYFSIIKDLIYNGFMYKGEKYIYFTSSAGQIRTKKCVFIKESVWEKIEKTIMCGLTIDAINEQGGINPNKYLAYLALANSATDEWKEFNIDKTIVVPDFESNVSGEVDFVDETDYSVNRKTMDIPIPHTDGVGMMLPNAFGVSQKNKMVRMPWIKGLLSPFDYVKFIQENNCSPVIKDIYGYEHNVIEEDIHVIFFASQFKLSKYYSDWKEYKDNFKKYNCSAGFTNEEEDRIKNATINYQMLQSLTDITDEEIYEIAKPSIDKIVNICSSVDSVRSIFGATPYNNHKTAFQKSICLYPNLLNDKYVKLKLKSIKDSLVKKYKSGKLEVNGKYTFILPDFYAICEYYFKHEDNPRGLLDNNEVFCWLFRNNDELDCLRSPHLFCEHAIRNNTAYKENEKHSKIREWFKTDGVYASTHDLISKILMYDVDGDKSLVVADKTIINVAKRNIDKYDIVPLYYNMRKALPSQINSDTLYTGLINAFTGGNIGIYSNNISKIWNSEIFITGSLEERKQALDCIKRLCCQNNQVIDYAKTLYKSEFPVDIKSEISNYSNKLLPAFFIYAKDKNDEQVEESNNSFVNKIAKIIPKSRINSKYIESDGLKSLPIPVYTFMTSVEKTIDKNEFMDKYNDVIEMYNEFVSKYYMKLDVNNKAIQEINRTSLYRADTKQSIIYGKIIREIKESFLKFGYSESEIADVLVTYTYGIKESKYKDLLWVCYGDYIYNNLSKNVKVQFKDAKCSDCGKWYTTKINSYSNKCPECYKIYRRYQNAKAQRKKRKNANK